MNLKIAQLARTVLLLALILSSMASAQDVKKLVLQGETGTAEIPLQGMNRDEESVRLAERIQKSQYALAKWRRSLDSNDGDAQRMRKLVIKLQDEAIHDVGAGYKISSNTSGGFPASQKSDIEKLLEMCDKIFSQGSKFQARVATHIGTPVTGGVIHYQEYGSTSKDWSTYSDGEIMDIGGYYFRVSAPNTKQFQELVVIIDNPHRHQITP